MATPAGPAVPLRRPCSPSGWAARLVHPRTGGTTAHWRASAWLWEESSVGRPLTRTLDRSPGLNGHSRWHIGSIRALPQPFDTPTPTLILLYLALGGCRLVNRGSWLWGCAGRAARAAVSVPWREPVGRADQSSVSRSQQVSVLPPTGPASRDHWSRESEPKPETGLSLRRNREKNDPADALASTDSASCESRSCPRSCHHALSLV